MTRLSVSLCSMHRCLRALVTLSLCLLLPVPVPAQASAPRAVVSRPTDGPGWYDSSWELSRGLELVEVPDLEAELTLWLEACLDAAPVSAPA